MKNILHFTIPSNTNIIRYFIFFILILLYPVSLYAIDFRLRIVDPVTGQALADTTVIILETGTKLFTDEKGETAASVPSPGYYTFRVVLASGIIQPRAEVRTENQLVTILTSSVTAKQNVGPGGLVVSGIRDKEKISRYQVRIDEVKRIPGTFGEAIRGIETLPGVNAPPSFGNFTIRGANPNANLILVDELPIGFLYHIFPLNSVLHNDFIKSFDLYNGVFPVQYGNATGGVVSMETIDDVKKFGGHSNVSLWSSNALFKGPTSASGGYWIGAARYSYMERTLRQFIPAEISPPRYWDYQFKLKFQLTQNQSLYFYLLGSKDVFAANVRPKPSWDPTAEPDPIFIGANVNLERAYNTTAIRHVWTPFARLENKITLLDFRNYSYIRGQLGSIRANQTRETGYTGIREELLYELLPEHILVSGGAELRIFNYRFTGETISQIDPTNPAPNPYNTTKPDFETIPVNDHSNKAYNSAWLQAKARWKGLEFRPGVRYEYFAPVRQAVVDPRATLSYTFETKTSLMAAAGTFHRVPDAETYSRTSGNPDLKMEKARHFGAGIEQAFANYSIKIEGFRHYYYDLVVEDGYIVTQAKPNYDLINTLKSPEKTADRFILRPQGRENSPVLYNQRLNYSNDGTGYSEGVEVFFKKTLKPNEKGIYGWISYTNMRARRNDHQYTISRDFAKTNVVSADERRIASQLYDNAKETYASFDRTHIANIIVGWKPDEEWQIGFRWRYLTSIPITPIVGDDGGQFSNNGRNIYNPVYSEDKFSRRLAPYHRLDVRIDKFFNYEWGYTNLYFEALNIYLRQNQDGESWSSARPYSRTNPEPQRDFSYLEIPGREGKKYIAPLFNIGMEVKF